MKFVMTVNMNGAAHQDNPNELRDLLRTVALKLDGNQTTRPMTVIDSNGNTVGYAQVTEDDV